MQLQRLRQEDRVLIRVYARRARDRASCGSGRRHRAADCTTPAATSTQHRCDNAPEAADGRRCQTDPPRAPERHPARPGRLQPTSSGTSEHGHRPHRSTRRASGAVAPTATTVGPGARPANRAQPSRADVANTMSPQRTDPVPRSQNGASQTSDRGACDCETFQSTPFAGPPGGAGPVVRCHAP